MHKSTMQLVLIALVAATPLAAQGGGGMGGMRMGGDPTAKVTGSGTLPTGWMMRFDPQRGGRIPAPTEISFVTMGGGFHVNGGPAAIYYNPKDMASGVYGASATFKQAKSLQHEAFGLFIGGSNLQDSTQNYLYMVIRPWDGAVAIEHRSSNAAPTKLMAMTPDAAINKDSPTDGSATNTLMIHVAKDTVHFMVNGKLVKALAKSDLGGAMTDGQAGIRINHNIDIHIDGWSVKK